MTEKNNNSQSFSGKHFAAGAILGALVGAATALLLAPKSGKELRGDIAEGYHQVSEKTHQVADTVGKKSREVYGTVSQKGQEWAGKARDTAEDLKTWVQARRNPAAEASETETLDAQAEIAAASESAQEEGQNN
ncbi:YtxH domain-containing protein [Xylanibacillus composti]|uniref:YtxH domain-containing protein n=1 Tax=Xylanibacillus composti TaxID=1572762 RepID=A0A8J4H3T4_9BACL|nr:YtxH domain-containing protein [Xylanibacillus composti]MDT9724917.1 YtxH domain-containing protein [Xylanibacillus composti]GIQ68153.1 YtxH domain-containing protein [Xylanibacillus composti]